MKEQASIELFQYWNRLRRDRSAPRRSEVEPADIKKLLGNTFILERDGRGEPVFRLAGTRLCAIYGRELKGFSFPSLWRPRDQRLIARMVNNTFTARAVVVLTYQGVSQKGRGCSFELLMLPLDGGEQNLRCLGIASAGRAAYWLGTDPVIQNEVASVRVVDPDREPVFLNNRPAVDVSPPLAPKDDELEADGAAPPARRVGHLLVFDGGRGEAG